MGERGWVIRVFFIGGEGVDKRMGTRVGERGVGERGVGEKGDLDRGK